MKTILFMLTFLSQVLFASPVDLRLDSHSGTGCPYGTVSATTTDSGQTLSIIFDEFMVQLPDLTGQNDNGDIYGSTGGINPHSRFVSNKNCLLNLMAHIEPGYRVDHIELAIDSRGATFLEPGILGRFMSQLDSYSGLAQYESRSGRAYMVGRKMWRPLATETDENWTITSNVIVPVASRCSTANDQIVHFQVKNHMILMNRTNNENLNAFMALDSQDIDSKLELRIQLSSCYTSSNSSSSSRTRVPRSSRSSRTSRSNRSNRSTRTTRRTSRRIPRY